MHTHLRPFGALSFFVFACGPTLPSDEAVLAFGYVDELLSTAERQGEAVATEADVFLYTCSESGSVEVRHTQAGGPAIRNVDIRSCGDSKQSANGQLKYFLDSDISADVILNTRQILGDVELIGDVAGLCSFDVTRTREAGNPATTENTSYTFVGTVCGHDAATLDLPIQL